MNPALLLQFAPLVISLFTHHHTPDATSQAAVTTHATAAGLPAAAVAAVTQVAQQPGGALSLAQILSGILTSQTPVSPEQFGAIISAVTKPPVS